MSRLKTLKTEVRLLDDERCVLCGMSRERHKSLYGTQHHVHHAEDEEETVDKMVTLCHICHNWVVHYDDKTVWEPRFRRYVEAGRDRRMLWLDAFEMAQFLLRRLVFANAFHNGMKYKAASIEYERTVRVVGLPSLIPGALEAERT